MNKDLDTNPHRSVPPAPHGEGDNKNRDKDTEFSCGTQISIPNSLDSIVTGANIKTVGIMRIASANDWMMWAALQPPLLALWHDMLYENEVTCIFSDTGKGKTILAVQIAVDVALMGRNVLYVDFELSPQQFASRYSNGFTQFTFPDNFYRCEVVQYADIVNFKDQAFESIKNGCESNSIDFVVIDNITWIDANTEKGDAAAELMTQLISLKREKKLTVLIISHTPKRYLNQPITENDLSGSKRIVNFLDAAIAIGESVKGSDIRYIKHIKGRNGKKTYSTENVLECKIVMGEDAFTRFVEIGTGPEYEHLKSKQEGEEDKTAMIVELKNQGKSYKEIEKQIGVSHSTAQRLYKKAIPPIPPIPPKSNGIDGIDGMNKQSEL